MKTLKVILLTCLALYALISMFYTLGIISDALGHKEGEIKYGSWYEYEKNGRLYLEERSDFFHPEIRHQDTSWFDELVDDEFDLKSTLRSFYIFNQEYDSLKYSDSLGFIRFDSITTLDPYFKRILVGYGAKVVKINVFDKKSNTTKWQLFDSEKDAANYLLRYGVEPEFIESNIDSSKYSWGLWREKNKSYVDKIRKSIDD